MITRLSSNDLAERAADVGPDPRLIGAVVQLEGPPPSATAVRALLATRLAEVDLLTRRIRPVPWGCGRPLWEDVRPDLDAHVLAETCPVPGDLEALLGLTARLAGQPLPDERPRWRLAVVDGLADGTGALVWLSDHTAADGPATLRSVLTALGGTPARPLDGTPARPLDGTVDPAHPAAPGRGTLARDAAATRLRALVRLPQGVALLGAAVLELAASAGARAPRTVLNRPVQAGIRLAVTEVDLAAFHAGARSCGATVNDAVLCAVGRVLHAELARRGAAVPRLVISCPVTVPVATAARGRTTVQNRVGVVRMPVPAPGGARPDELRDHLAQVALLARPRKQHLSGASTVVLSPVFRALAALRLYRPMVEHQRTMNTLVTNLRGPDSTVRLCERSVRRVVPVTPLVGNVPIAAVALSFGGRLSVTLRVAPALWPQTAQLRDALQAELAAICALADGRPGGAGS